MTVPTLAIDLGIDQSSQVAPSRNAESFHCLQCSAKFRRSAHLRRHLATHRYEKPYTCGYCSTSSSRKDVILRHTRNFHPGLAPLVKRQTRPTNNTNGSEGSGCSSDFSRSCMQDLSGAANTPGISPRLVLGHSPPVDQPPTMRPLTYQDNWSAQAESQDTMNLEVFATNPSFWDGPALMHNSMLDLVASSHTADLSMSHVFDPDLTSPYSSPLSSDLLQDVGEPSAFYPPARSSSTDQTVEPCPDSPIFVCDDDYSEAQGNLAKCGVNVGNFRFPSKYALMRFVQAFFASMAPHFPILHRPTFAIASIPSPLLLAVMACGAIYSDESEEAASIHLAALQLMSKHEDVTVPRTEEKALQLWELQTSLLLSYFGAYSKCLTVRRKSLNLFSYAIELAKKAIQDIPSFDPLEYRDWVYQESIIRCVAGVGILGAALNYEMQAQTFDLPDFQSKIRLPSTRNEWMKDEQSWKKPPPAPYSADVIEKTFAGQPPELPVDDLAFLTIVSGVLNHICSFEVLMNGRYPSLWEDFVDRLSPPMQLLDKMCNEQLARTTYEAFLPTPILQCVRSFLDSAIYHLHGCRQLSGLKRLMLSPGSLHEPEELNTLFRAPHLDIKRRALAKALVRAAATLKTYCRMGLRRLQRTAPYVYAPMAATAVIEAGLLLYWYARSDMTTAEVEALLKELEAEIKSIQLATNSQSGLLPLVAAAEVLQESTVWQGPPTMSASLKVLITTINSSVE
ncbi:hypothetical protein NX059_011785 [Plenodomus lindquistii]|nr:hypothetical protein NX059_011785 [Plenodomus lindquistii]